MLDKLPQTLAFILINDVDPSPDGFFNGRPVLGIFVALIIFTEFGNIIRPIEDDGGISVREVHVAVGLNVVDSQAIIVVNFVAFVLIGPMRNDLKNEEAGQLLRQLQLECSLTYIGCFENTAEILSRFNVFEDHFGAVDHVDLFGMLLIVEFALESIFELRDLLFRPFAESIALLGSG
jgi:hypothetical protein